MGEAADVCRLGNIPQREQKDTTMNDAPKITAANCLQNLGQNVERFSYLGNMSFSPTIQELNRLWSGRGSTVVGDKDRQVEQLEPDDALFGTHLREAIRTVRGR